MIRLELFLLGMLSTTENISLRTLAPELKRIMENSVPLNVPLVCDMAYGPNLTDLIE